MSEILISNNQVKTIEIGEKLAGKLEPADLICLYGQLGAGKTVLAKGIAKGLGIEEEIVSPSYTLLKEYQISKKLKLAHFDFYRIDDNLSQPPADLSDYLGDRQYIVVIEWPERVEDFLPDKRINIYLEYINENRRKVVIE